MEAVLEPVTTRPATETNGSFEKKLLMKRIVHAYELVQQRSPFAVAYVEDCVVGLVGYLQDKGIDMGVFEPYVTQLKKSVA